MKTKLTTYMHNNKITSLLLALGFLTSSSSFAQGLLNTGHMHVGQNPNASSLFIQGDWVHQGDNVAVSAQGNTVLTGDFIHGATRGNIFQASDNLGRIIFNGSRAQRIFSGSTDAAQVGHIGFPNIEVNNSQGVWVNPDMRIQADNLYLPGGKFVLESTALEGVRESTTAHLLVNKVHYNHNLADAKDPNQGIVQVNLALGNNHTEKRLVGFSSPFKSMYADYFTYNFLSSPSPSGLFGDSGTLITDVSTPLQVGKGYIIGQGIVDDESYYLDNLDPKWQGALPSDRAKEQFEFARNMMPNSFYNLLSTSNMPDLVTGEELNVEDVHVSLDRQGFHYLGNPFMAPIDMNGFLQETAAADEWGVSRSADGSGDMRNSFYVMSGGTGEHFPTNTYTQFKFSVSYLVGQNVGGTINIDPTDNYVAPMQMFVVGKNSNTPTNFTIPASARRIDKRSNFLRSTTPSVVDEVLLQVTDEDTKAYDRVAIVLREGASLNATDQYDASKIFNFSKGVSQIYTKSGEGKNMTTNVVSPQTKSLALHLDPASDPKTSVITAHRLESLRSADYLFLEDKKTKEVVDLLHTPSYTFTTSPGDDSDRFVVHFTRLTTGVEDIQTQNELGIYYADGMLHINGLTADDHGSQVTVSNMQGSTLLHTRIDQSPSMSIQQGLSTGVYIVKVSGTNNYSTKIIAK